MKLIKINDNAHTLELGSMSVLFSYQTPVAFWDESITAKLHPSPSVTTTKHINSVIPLDNPIIQCLAKDRFINVLYKTLNKQAQFEHEHHGS